jgi:endonuclease/exonuclease/phosphatase family metal-dependent hydrolase
MTWNLWWRFGPEWRERQPAILRTLRAVEPDVVALQEVWGTGATTQAHELAGPLGLHAAFVETSLPPAPDPPQDPDHEGVLVGLGLLSRWPITRCRALPMPAEHRRPAPTTLLAELAHPQGPLHVAVACLEWEPEFDADRHARPARWPRRPPTRRWTARYRSWWPATSTPPRTAPCSAR